MDSGLFSQWFPVDLTVDFSSLPHHRAPPRAFAGPAASGARTEGAQGDVEPRICRPHYPRTPNGYGAADFPFIDQTLRATIARSGGDSSSVFQYSTFLTGDLLFHEADAYVFGDQHGVQDVRATIGRRDPERGLLGPLHATEYAAGDVLFPGLELISVPRFPAPCSRTIRSSSRTQFDRHTFAGLPEGWDVELYQNRALIGFQQHRPDGLYEFDNVPLVFGLNEFRLIFYGPQGQRREETARFNIAESLTPAGELYYRVVANDPKGSTRRGQLDFDFGISRHFSASLDLSSVELDHDVRHDYGRLGLRGYSDAIFADAEVVVDRSGGVAASAALQTRVGPVGITARYTGLADGFISETFRPIYGEIRSRASLRLDATIPAGRSSGIPAVVEFTEDRLASGSVGRSPDRKALRLLPRPRGVAPSRLDLLARRRRPAARRLGDRRSSSASSSRASACAAS